MEDDIEKLRSVIKTYGVFDTFNMLKSLLEEKNNISESNKYIKREVSQEIIDSLTENNLRMWVIDEKQSFRRIADRLGCHPDIVSNYAKKYGIKSHYTPQLCALISNRRYIQKR